jgi:AAA domain
MTSAGTHNNGLLDRVIEVMTKRIEHLRRLDRPEPPSVVDRAKAYLLKVPPAISGQGGHSQCFTVAFALIEGFALSVEDSLAVIQAWNETCKPPWSEKELRHKLEDALKKCDPAKRGHLLHTERPPAAPAPATPIAPSAEPPAATAIESAPKQPKAGQLLDQGISCADLMSLDLPEPTYVVSGLVPEGLTILAARPKTGKSWLALQLAIGIASGAVVLGSLQTTPGKVLYLALEDTRHRLKKRARKLLESMKLPAPANLIFRTATQKSKDGGLVHLSEWLDENKADAKFVIVDTLAKFRTAKKGASDSYSDDYEAVGGLKEVADRYGVSMMVIHHSRKADAESPFDQVSGTLGLTGAADAVFVLDRSHDSADAKLFITGRDVEEETLTITWNAETSLWTLNDRAGGVVKQERETFGSRAHEAAKWLNDKLAGGPMRVSALRTMAEVDGFSTKTLYAGKQIAEVVEYEKDRRKWWRSKDSFPDESIPA